MPNCFCTILKLAVYFISDCTFTGQLIEIVLTNWLQTIQMLLQIVTMPIQLVMESLLHLVLKFGITIGTTQRIGYHQLAYYLLTVRYCEAEVNSICEILLNYWLFPIFLMHIEKLKTTCYFFRIISTKNNIQLPLICTIKFYLCNGPKRSNVINFLINITSTDYIKDMNSRFSLVIFRLYI